MGQALYRKYRSKSLREIVGQEHITDTLAKAFKAGRISHAYLFTGPRGVGKTSIARIVAHEINGLPYTDDQTHIDIIEIDAASNRRIDEIRDLREKVYVAPAAAKYKVYIIDEVHMLTREAFNALLKTLEEPPAHVVFILATTEAHKLPETIVSRTQRFVFRPIEPGKVALHLRKIAQQEKIDISDEALELIAKHGDGSFRDSISLLDQLGSHGAHIDVATVQASLGVPPLEAIDALVAAIARHDSATELLQRLNQLYEQGFQAAAIAKQLAQVLRQQIIDNSLLLKAEAATALLAQLLEVSASHDPERYLEIVLLSLADNHQPATTPAVKRTEKAASSPRQLEVAAPAATAAKIPKKMPATTTHPTELNAAVWNQVLTRLKSQHNTLYGIVRMAKPEFAAGQLTLTFAFAFHQKRIHEAKNQQIISAVIQEVTGLADGVRIECLLDTSLKLTDQPIITNVAAPTEPEPSKPAETDASLVTISNIFGGGELLQS